MLRDAAETQLNCSRGVAEMPPRCRRRLGRTRVVSVTRLRQAEIDPLSIPGRRRAAKAEGMQSVWEQAQAMFKQKVAERAPPAMLDLGEGGEADEGAEERE